MLINARSLLYKIDELRLTVALKKPSIICITETWLNPDIDSALLRIPDYNLCRSDRCSRKGGGTCIFIRDFLNFHNRTPEFADAADVEFSIIDITNFNLLLICIYVPPNLSSKQLSDVEKLLMWSTDTLLSNKPLHHLMIAGDMNHLNVGDICEQLSLTDLVTNPTRLNKILDHILISSSLSIAYSSQNTKYDAPLGNSDHRIVTVSPNKEVAAPKNIEHHTVYDFRHSNITALMIAMNEIEWSLLAEIQNPNDQWTVFYETFAQAIKKHVPTREVILSDRDKEWMTPLTKCLINDRWEAFRKGNWGLYEHLKKKTKVEIANAKSVWFKKHSTTPRGLWKMVGKERREHVGIHGLINEKVGVTKLLDMISERLDELFSAASTQNDIKCCSDDQEWNLQVSIESVRIHLSKLSANKATGPDGIPTKLYKDLADVIATPLTIIFNKSLTTKTFPEAWKHGYIVPIPKTKPPALEKLRYLTLLSTPSKILEKIVYQNMRAKFEGEYGNHQHGFRGSHSTTTALVDIVDNISSALDIPLNFGAALLSFDLSSAFDTVDHALLIRCLRGKLFPSGFLQWLLSYLHDRRVSVRINDQLSNPIFIKRGVAQGSVLAPPLFCVFVSGLVSPSSNAATVKYADDLNIILTLPSTSSADIQEAIEREKTYVQDWCSANNLVLNVSKSKAMLLTRDQFFDG